MGHQEQGRKNYQSTQTSRPKEINDPEDFIATPVISNGTKTNHVYANVIDIPPFTGQIYTDQTRRFPIQSSNGHNYIMVLYDYDSNAILAEPLCNRTTQEIL
jgi:hypothetical protein